MALRREMDDRSNLVLANQPLNQILITNIAMNEMHPARRKPCEAGAIPCIRERVEHDHPRRVIRADETLDEIHADESCATGYQYRFQEASIQIKLLRLSDH